MEVTGTDSGFGRKATLCPDLRISTRRDCMQFGGFGLKENGKGDEYEFRAVTTKDLEKEKVVQDYIKEHLAEWQEKGYVPEVRIEEGRKTSRPIRERGWTYWHHLFNPRQLLVAGLVNQTKDAVVALGLCKFWIDLPVEHVGSSE